MFVRRHPGPPSALHRSARRGWLGLGIVLLLSAPPALLAQDEAGALSGTVVDQESGVPVEGARIGLLGTVDRFETVSDAAGAFRFPSVPAGDYAFRVDHLAYGTVTSAVEVLAGEETVLRATVSTSAILLDGVEVTVLSRR